VTGCKGLLGNSLVHVLERNYEVIGIDHKTGKSGRDLVVDISQREPTIESIEGIAPQIVVHTAGLTDVDYCELNVGLARRVNVGGTQNVAEACQRTKAKLTFISTDYVFDGVKGSYSESDLPNPVNFYGLTKLEAERVAAASSNSLIIRSSVLYGWHSTKLNFATWILQSLRKNKKLPIVSDQFNSPTFVDNLSLAISRAIDRDAKGTLHIAGSERVSRFEFAKRLAIRFNLDEKGLFPVKMGDLNWIAKRPRDSSLDVRKAEKELSIELFGVERGLEEMSKTEP